MLWFTVEMLYQLVWAYARFSVEMMSRLACMDFTVEMLYQLMLGLLRKCCMGLCSVLGGFA